MRVIIYAKILNADEVYEEGLTFYTVDGDYITHAIFDVDTDKCIYCDDNTHDNPDRFFDGLCAGIELAGDSALIHEALIILNEGELDSNFIDVCAAIRRYIKENDL